LRNFEYHINYLGVREGLEMPSLTKISFEYLPEKKKQMGIQRKMKYIIIK
jgi:hypothetical protein